MTILDEIIANKKIEVARESKKITIKELEASVFFDRKCNSLKESLQKSNSSGIIAEYKRKSPSKGNINIGAGIVETTTGYANFGAAGISILTDTQFFGGFKQDLTQARQHLDSTPLLRKDFMIAEYQLFEAKAWGADAILLIAANLTAKEIKELSKKAHNLGLEVLLEVHNKEEIEKSDFSNIDIVGVNNRNLKNFAENNINASKELFEFLPKEIIKISESCISEPATVLELKNIGYKGFLMGENFMKTISPHIALKEFIAKISA